MSDTPALGTIPAGLHFGALGPSLLDQVGHLVSTDEQREEIEHLDRDANAVSRLKVRGLIAESAANRARDKIAKAVWKALQHG